MTYYKCKRCKKRFISEKLVKIHLQWVHNIPPRELVEGIKKFKKEFLDK